MGNRSRRSLGIAFINGVVLRFALLSLLFTEREGGNFMSLISDLIEELKVAEALEKAMVDGGSDLLDIQAGDSTLSSETIVALREKLDHETRQLLLISACLVTLRELVSNGYPVRRVFDVPESVVDELALKQKQMLDFALELRSVVIGADGGAIMEVGSEVVG